MYYPDQLVKLSFYRCSFKLNFYEVFRKKPFPLTIVETAETWCTKKISYILTKNYTQKFNKSFGTEPDLTCYQNLLAIWSTFQPQA